MRKARVTLACLVLVVAFAVASCSSQGGGTSSGMQLGLAGNNSCGNLGGLVQACGNEIIPLVRDNFMSLSPTCQGAIQTVLQGQGGQSGY